MDVAIAGAAAIDRMGAEANLLAAGIADRPMRMVEDSMV